MSDLAEPSWVHTLIGSLVSGVAGFFTARLTIKSQERVAEAAGDDAVDAAAAADLSRRYRALFDGYEHHIDDLRAEIVRIRDGYEARIKALTDEVSDLRRRVEHCEACRRIPSIAP